MKKAKVIGSFVAKIATNFLLAIILFVAVSQFKELNVLACASTLTLVSVVFQLAVFALGEATQSKFAFMALQQEIWVPFIQENLFPDNKFMEKAEDHSEYVEYLTVHLPQAGANPGVFKNNTNLPIAISNRVDNDFTYQINNYKLEPRLITDLEELQVSYPKRESVMANYFKEAGYAIANNCLYSWAPAGATRMVRTSGSPVSTALAPSATGTRNAITLADIAALKGILDKDNVPMEGRQLLMTSDQYNNQLLAINNIQAFYAYNRPTLADGKAPTIYGFEVMIRPTVLVYDNTGTPIVKSVGDDGVPTNPAATDNLAMIAWHPKFASKAQGSIKVFAQQDRPEYYGSIFSAEVQFGASPLRSTGIGFAVLVQQ
jgi:hypothetical protein